MFRYIFIVNIFLSNVIDTKSGYSLSVLNSFCELDENCSGITHAACSKVEKKCVCISGNVPFNETVCSPTLGNFCWQKEACATANSVCIDNECQCRTGLRNLDNQCILYIPSVKSILDNPKRRCRLDSDCVPNAVCIAYQCQSAYIPPYLNMPCDNTSSCLEHMEHTVCSNTKRCACDIGYGAVDDDICAPVINVACSSNVPCISNNSMCIDGVCQCKPGFMSKRLNCVPKILKDQCDKDSDCSYVEFARCLNEKCACLENYAVSNETCAPTLGQLCRKVDQCFVANSTCIENKCQCRKDHSASADKQKCFADSLGRFCQSNSECELIKNSKCSHNQCVCNDNNFALNKSACAPVFKGYCLNDDECQFKGFHCVENECKCKQDFLLASVDKCIPAKSLFSCHNVDDCGEPWHYQCSTDLRCVCSSNNTAVTWATCYPILNGYCWVNHQCQVENSECADYHCACKPGFVSASQNLCVPSMMSS